MRFSTDRLRTMPKNKCISLLLCMWHVLLKMMLFRVCRIISAIAKILRYYGFLDHVCVRLTSSSCVRIYWFRLCVQVLNVLSVLAS